MKVSVNNTIVDLAFNLSGSLAGIPVILQQLPVGERVGTPPEVWEDVKDIGQTWTPAIGGLDLDIKDVPLYNILGQAKAPYTSNIYAFDEALEWADLILQNFVEMGLVE